MKCGHQYHWWCLLKITKEGKWYCPYCQDKEQHYVMLACEECAKYYKDEHLYFSYWLAACNCDNEENHNKCIENQISQIQSKGCVLRNRPKQ